MTADQDDLGTKAAMDHLFVVGVADHFGDLTHQVKLGLMSFFVKASVEALKRAGLALEKYPADYVRAALETCKGKVKLFSELAAYAGFCFKEEVGYDPEAAQRDFTTENKPQVAKLREESFRVRGLLDRMRVQVICTTDDPTDSLEHHDRLRHDISFPVTVVPGFRPDPALAIENPKTFNKWINRLGAAAGTEVRDWSRLLVALRRRIDTFNERGCRLSDHGIEEPYAADFTEGEVRRIFSAARKGNAPSAEEALKYRSALLVELVVSWTVWSHHLMSDQAQPGMLKTVSGEMVTAFELITQGLAFFITLATLWSARPLKMTMPLRFLLGGLLGFALAVPAGIMQADLGLNRILHNTQWIVGPHVHVAVLVGLTMTLYSAIYLLFPIVTNGAKLYSEKLALFHFWAHLFGGIGMGAFMGMAGLQGMLRRSLYVNGEFNVYMILAALSGSLLLFAFLAFFYNIVMSLGLKGVIGIFTPSKLDTTDPVPAG